MRLRPNPPKLITIGVAVVLLVIGLGLVFANAEVANVIKNLPLGTDVTRQLLDLATQRTVAYLALAASPLLLIAGSLFKGL
jgi:hypothetical protein